MARADFLPSYIRVFLFSEKPANNRPGFPVEMHAATLPIADLLKQVTESRTKRSGPGGQHRNKTETAVVLIHKPTGISAEGSERRSQSENRAVALKRLRLKLAIEHRSPASSSGPSELWRSRTRGRQLVISAGHDDYPSIVAEALDSLQFTGWQVSPAAETLCVTTSQLIGLFKRNPAVLVAVNRQREAMGLPALK